MTAADVEIRFATAEDAALLARLGASTFEEAFAAENDPRDMAAYVEAAFSVDRLAAELADPRSVFLLAEVGREAVGYARLFAGDPEDGVRAERPIELVRIYSLPAWIGRGVGPRLLAASIAEAQARGHDVLWLGVWERNTRAQAFYRKWGFAAVGKHTFQLGSDPQTDLVMERKLGS